jgi:hypothetical protein
MSRLTIGILGAIALSLSAGAAQLALGRDLSQLKPQVKPRQSSLDVEISVNRGTKADRAMKAPVSAAETRTVALQLNGFSDTSFLVRVPIADGLGKPQSPPVTTPGNQRPKVACEPVVSMLTDVAKQLQPGRCVT